MSGVPIIGKVFDTLEKGVKHAIKEVDKNPVLKAAVIAAAVYFTVGAAVEYFSATAATTTVTAGATTQAGMLASQTAAFGAEGAALTAESLAFAPGATGAVASAATNAAVNSQAVAGAVGATPPPTPPPTDGGGIANWINKNPTSSLLLGQSISGAAQGYSANETAQDQIKARQAEQERAYAEAQRVRDERGLFGFDKNGQQAGIVASAMQQPSAPPPQATAPQATAAPIIASQQAAGVAPIEAPRVAVQRSDLPKLNKQNQLNIGQA